MKITVKGWSSRQKLNKMQIISQFKKYVDFFLDEQQKCSLVSWAEFVILFVDSISSVLSRNSIARNVYLGEEGKGVSQNS